MNKYDYTLAALDILKPLIKKKSELFLLQPLEGVNFIYSSKFNDGLFYFNFNSKQIENTESDVQINLLPSGANSLTPRSYIIKAKAIEENLNYWNGLLEAYNFHNIFDDPNISQFQNEFYSEFEIVEDKDIDQPLKINQIIFIDSFLNKLSESIDKNRFLENSQITDIKEEIGILKISLANDSKRKISLQLAKIFALLRKNGVDVLKAFWNETKKKAISGMLNWGIENAPKILENLHHHSNS